MLSRLALTFLLVSTAGALAQPAVPPLPGARPAAQTAPAPTAAPVTRPAPAAAVDAPPTSDAAPGSSPAAQAATEAPPTSDAPSATQTASATPNAAPTTTAESAQPAVPPTVTKNYPVTAEGNARFLADYAARPDVKKLTAGVMYRVLHAATAAKANGPLVNNDTVTVSYRGWLIDGTVFDQTKPGIPALFSLGGLIPGWRTALLKMKVGDLWEIAIPADQAYGEEGRPGRIPPNQTLIFVVSLAKVEYAG
jgi:FKBP-type peptidyl-prolyl cis-trans isomerase